MESIVKIKEITKTESSDGASLTDLFSSRESVLLSSESSG
jgi:hypothetical protein